MYFFVISGCVCPPQPRSAQVEFVRENEIEKRGTEKQQLPRVAALHATLRDAKLSRENQNQLSVLLYQARQPFLSEPCAALSGVETQKRLEKSRNFD